MRVTMYAAEGCHLCDSARDAIGRVRQRRRFELDVVLIDGNPDLETRFRPDIPVVHINGRFAARYRVDEDELARRIEAAERET